MTWYEFWLFLHILAAMVWVGGGVAIQVFGVLTKRAADPAKTVFFVRSVAKTVMNVFLPAAVVIFVSGVGLVENGNLDWGEPFIVYGLVLLAAISLVAFGYLARNMRAAADQLEREGPSPALGLRMRNLVWLSRGLLAALVTIVFMMVAKLELGEAAIMLVLVAAVSAALVYWFSRPGGQPAGPGPAAGTPTSPG